MERGSIDFAQYNVQFDKYHLFFGLVPRMIDLARYSADNEALSYRHFNVGAAIFAVDPELRQTALFSAGNRKLTENCPKYCAEMNVIDQSEAAGSKEAVLHPCSPCLDKFENSSVIKPDTFVVTIGTDAEVYQVHTVTDLQQLYGKMPHPLAHNTAESPAQEHSLKHWQERQAMYGWLTHPNAQEMGLNNLAPHEAARVALTTTFN
jgi:hypothetical protein